MNALTVSNLLADKDVLHILSATYYHPKSVQELCKMFEIPPATCYRKIHELQNSRLLKIVERSLSRKGKWMKKYQSQINSVNIYYEKTKIKVDLDLAYIGKEEYIEALDKN